MITESLPEITCRLIGFTVSALTTWSSCAIVDEPALEIPPAAQSQTTSLTRVEVVRAGEDWLLYRDGKPYMIRGACAGTGSLEELAKLGANSIRTWGISDLQKRLDEAHRLGLSVAVGIWLGHERDGFHYDNAVQVAKQREIVRRAVSQFKDHPAVLLWGLGNEMEADGDNPDIWSEINFLAAMVKQIDPDHPTMTVIAELGGNRVKNIHRLCPAVDVVGVNAYGGAATVPKRYVGAGGIKPFILTEYGPPGRSESQKSDWGAPIELSSTDKAPFYRRSYQQASREGLCLGSYAFVWGHKHEITATWFGMLLQDGSRTAAVDVLTELWSGKAPNNRCPVIRKLAMQRSNQVTLGARVRVDLEVFDPEGDPFQIEWLLRKETRRYDQGGDAEEPAEVIDGAVLESSVEGCRLVVPNEPGAYRIFVAVRDASRGAAVANVPLLVK
jgi:hypothetical protein